jgi:hypothetical protein
VTGGDSAARLYPAHAATDVLERAREVVTHAGGAVLELRLPVRGREGVVRAVVPWRDGEVNLYDVTVTVTEDDLGARTRIVAEIRRTLADDARPVRPARKPCNCPSDDLQRVETRARSSSAELHSARQLAQALLRVLDGSLR